VALHKQPQQPFQQAYRPAQPGDRAWDDRLLPAAPGPVLWCDVPDEHWHPQFHPSLAPPAMAQAGVFGDAYWGGPNGEERAAMLPAGFPLTRGGVVYARLRGAQCGRINRYGRPASLRREWWLHKGLVSAYDPQGWFEWFVWYWLGRRIAGYDSWQVQRRRKFIDRQLRMGALTPGLRQALLHWAYTTEG
jgi:hypothetical protein